MLRVFVALFYISSYFVSLAIEIYWFNIVVWVVRLLGRNRGMAIGIGNGNVSESARIKSESAARGFESVGRSCIRSEKVYRRANRGSPNIYKGRMRGARVKVENTKRLLHLLITLIMIIGWIH